MPPPPPGGRFGGPLRDFEYWGSEVSGFQVKVEGEVGVGYRCFNFLCNRLSCAVDSVASAGEGDFSLGVVLVELRGDIDAAAS